MNLFWMIVITLAIVQLSNFCTTIYLHRSLAHRGLVLHPAVAGLMHLELTLFTGMIPREWVAVHRKHHHFSDQEGDPHSPYLQGLWTVLFGNVFLYRRETRNPQTIAKYTPNWKSDWIDRIPHNHLGLFLGLDIFMLLFGWAWGIAAWATHIALYVLLNSTINSVCHMIGYRTFRNLATNLQSVALITAGEGLHNNHHEFPTSAKLSFLPREFDPAWGLIRLFEKLGLATVQRLPSAKAA